jgi:hypothetical protein
MRPNENVIRYSTGERARAGDRVIDDVWPAIVEAVISSPEEMANWGVDEPGLMLLTEAAGLVFEYCSSIAWDAIVLVASAADS